MLFIRRLLAVGLTVCIVNVLCYAYYNPTHNSSKNIYRLEPNGIGFQATEGVAITYTDSNGFTNRQLPIEEENCILVMGSSQGAGQNVPIEDRFSDRLNSMLGYQDSLKVYNVSYSGGDFADIIHNYKEIMEEFPQTQTVFIELDSAHLSMSESNYEYAMNQINMADSVTGEKLSSYSSAEIPMIFLKKSLPLGLLFVKQYLAWRPLMTNISFETIGLVDKNIDVSEEKIIQEQKEEMRYWDSCLELVSKESKAKIVIVFHDPIDMDANEDTDTTLPVKMKEIEKICSKYNIDVINMIPIFTQNYLENYELPYGFYNTELNEGHLNKIGHKLIAEEMYKYLTEKN